MAGAPKENKNAEKWTKEESVSFMDEALELSYNEDYDFIGEIAKKLRVDKGTFDYLIDKFPNLKSVKKHMLSNCEANCFRNSKKGNINTAVGIVNLKSNHGWTDRAETTLQGGDKPIQTTVTKLTPEQIKALNNEIEDDY